MKDICIEHCRFMGDEIRAKMYPTLRVLTLDGMHMIYEVGGEFQCANFWHAARRKCCEFLKNLREMYRSEPDQ